MSGGIFVLNEEELVETHEQSYDSDDLLQTLLPKYPNLLADGDQLAGSPRRWLLVKHRLKLAERPPAVFALGPKTADPHGLAESRAQFDKALAKVPEVEPRSIAVFGGVVDPKMLRFPLNRMPASDARDWGAIDEWADDVATTLEPSALAGRKS